MVNLQDRDNLQRKDKEPVPKMSFVWRFDCISAVALIHCCAGLSGELHHCA